MKLGFIGCGNMGGALATAVKNANFEKEILLLDKNEELQNNLALKLGAKTASLKEIINECNFIFLGVKPQVISVLASEICEFLPNATNKPVFISMLAGVKIEKLESLLLGGA